MSHVLHSSVYWKVWKPKCSSVLFSDSVGMEWKAGIKAATRMRRAERDSCNENSGRQKRHQLRTRFQPWIFRFWQWKIWRPSIILVDAARLFFFIWCFRLTCKNAAAAARENPLHEAKIAEALDKKKKSNAKLEAIDRSLSVNRHVNGLSNPLCRRTNEERLESKSCANFWSFPWEKCAPAIGQNTAGNSGLHCVSRALSSPPE